jgi:hypothetical protein
MNGKILSGILLIATGAFPAGSFTVPFGKIKGWRWETYGMGKSQMGPYTFSSWGILMALTIAFSTVWGLIRK